MRELVEEFENLTDRSGENYQIRSLSYCPCCIDDAQPAGPLQYIRLIDTRDLDALALQLGQLQAQRHTGVAGQVRVLADQVRLERVPAHVRFGVDQRIGGTGATGA